jgi:hypothetical protein
VPVGAAVNPEQTAADEETVAANVTGEAPGVVVGSAAEGSAEEFNVTVVAGRDAACTEAFRLEVLIAKLLSPL